jgi:anti-sigma regulatory factor (Ser/Thr protein kinase)
MIQLLSDPGRLRPGAHRARSEPARAPSPPPSRGGGDAIAPTRAGAPCAELQFSAGSLRDVRRLVAREAERARLGRLRREDLALAVDELATNSVVHGGGRGALSVWRADGSIVCEVRDQGHIRDPLVGLRPPAPEQTSGRGLWIVGRLCDSVHVCSSPGRTAVRVQMRAG